MHLNGGPSHPPHPAPRPCRAVLRHQPLVAFPFSVEKNVPTKKAIAYCN